jgi:hypothetical protein
MEVKHREETKFSPAVEELIAKARERFAQARRDGKLMVKQPLKDVLERLVKTEPLTVNTEKKEENVNDALQRDDVIKESSEEAANMQTEVEKINAKLGEREERESAQTPEKEVAREPVDETHEQSGGFNEFEERWFHSDSYVIAEREEYRDLYYNDTLRIVNLSKIYAEITKEEKEKKE